MTENYVNKQEFIDLQEKLRQMSKQYVTKEELENVKEKIKQVNEDVKEIKIEMTESGKLLQAIDKKIDIINQKINTSDEIEELKLAPLENRVTALEENQTWMRRTFLGQIIAIIIAAIVFVLKMQ